MSTKLSLTGCVQAATFLVKSAAILSNKEMADLLPTAEEADESPVTRGFGHLLEGPVSRRRYGRARTMADAAGMEDEVSWAVKHPHTSRLLTMLAGGGLGLGAGILAGLAVPEDHWVNGILGTSKYTTALGAGSFGRLGLGLGMSGGYILDAFRKAQEVERLRGLLKGEEMSKKKTKDSKPGAWQFLTGDYDQGVQDVQRVLDGGEAPRNATAVDWAHRGAYMLGPVPKAVASTVRKIADLPGDQKSF